MMDCFACIPTYNINLCMAIIDFYPDDEYFSLYYYAVPFHYWKFIDFDIAIASCLQVKVSLAFYSDQK